MTLVLQPQDELRELLHAAAEGSLTADGVERIDRLVGGDGRLLREYVEYMRLISDLRCGETNQHVEQTLARLFDSQEVVGGSPGESRESRVESGTIVASDEWRVASEADFPESPDSRIPNPEIPRFSLPSPLSSLHSAWAFSYSVATVLLAIFLLSAWSYTITHPSADSLAVKNSRGATHSGSDANKNPEFTFVGRVSGMVDCRWADEATATSPGAAVGLNRRYAIKSGLMEITYDSGAKVILQGPCDYKVESPRGGFLQMGKLVARVGEGSGVGGQGSGTNLPSPIGRGAGGEGLGPHSQPALTLALSQRERGRNPESPNSRTPNPKSPTPRAPRPTPLFAVRTPTALVEDLGTEFGVEVLQSGETSSHVFQGQVRVRLDGAGNGGRGAGNQNPESPNPRTSNHELVLSAGQSARVVAGERAVRPATTGCDAAANFVRAMPLPQAVQESQAYEKLVLSLDPAVYYRMERPKPTGDRFLVFDSAAGGHHGQLRLGNDFGGSPYWNGRFGDSLNFRGPYVSDRVIVPDYPKTTNDRLTVSAWVLAAGRPEWAMIASNWGEEVDRTGQFHISLYPVDGDLVACVTQRDGRRIELREGENYPFPLGVWQHVAIVADGAMLRLYRNGKEVASAACEGILREMLPPGLGIGCRTNTEGTEAQFNDMGRNFWIGRIDELAIFNKSLTPEQIEKLFHGRSGNSAIDSTIVKEGRK